MLSDLLALTPETYAYSLLNVFTNEVRFRSPSPAGWQSRVARACANFVLNATGKERKRR